MHEHASEMPLHGALVEIASRIAEGAAERSRTYEAVAGGSAMCPTCHIVWDRPFALDPVEDKDDKSRYVCKQCGERYKLGR